MKTNPLIITSVMLMLTVAARAQYVTIPDAKFSTYLNTIIPTAMSGNQMDTTKTAVKNLHRLSIEALGIADLTGAQYFRALITLDCGNGYSVSTPNTLTSLPALATTLDTLICGNNKITSLPALPNILQYLACYGNQLTGLPALSDSLTWLDCNTNKITSIPTLPLNLFYLDCGTNQLTSLPAMPGNLFYLVCKDNQLTGLPALPSYLYTLDCSYNKLTGLASLPSGLSSLYCNNNPSMSPLNLPASLSMVECGSCNMTSLPALPATLTFLACESNPIISLPALPASLTTLDCQMDSLTSLPALPVGLTTLQCYQDKITSLPTLPNSLTALWCYNNKITSIPNLPKALTQLECENNKIDCFPVFPNSLAHSTFFNISGNPFTCLPNYLPGMTITLLSYPLCLPGNTNGCPTAEGIVGYTYDDLNSNCKKDTADKMLKNIPIGLYDLSNNLLNLTYTAINGVYDFPDTMSTYIVKIDTAAMPYQAQCAHPGLDSTVKLNGLDTVVDFSLDCRPGFDVGVQSVVTNGLVFPGMQHNLSIVAGDMSRWYNLSCANGDSGTIEVSVSGPVTYIGPGPGALKPDSVSVNVFKYTIPHFDSINNSTAFNLIFRTDTSAKAGDTICVSVAVSPLADNNPSNNTYHYCYGVSNSHDPNNKSVYPVNVAPLYDGWFTYTIHFQNTGSAPAHNVIISDIIDNNLDVSTFQLINYSNPNTTYLKNRVLTINFLNINLPDSSANPSGSKGFAQYRMKPLPNLPFGTSIYNTADIDFDFNSPVITDTTLNLFIGVTSVNGTQNNTSFKVYPNPGNGEFTFTTIHAGLASESQAKLEVYNVLGEKVYTQGIVNSSSFMVDLNQPDGIYFYRITNETGGLINEGKLVIEK
jgi:uncharacterized repeat protein (TIGR01451 family)